MQEARYSTGNTKVTKVGPRPHPHPRSGDGSLTKRTVHPRTCFWWVDVVGGYADDVLVGAVLDGVEGQGRLARHDLHARVREGGRKDQGWAGRVRRELVQGEESGLGDQGGRAVWVCQS